MPPQMPLVMIPAKATAGVVTITTPKICCSLPIKRIKNMGASACTKGNASHVVQSGPATRLSRRQFFPPGWNSRKCFAVKERFFQSAQSPRQIPNCSVIVVEVDGQNAVPQASAAVGSFKHQSQCAAKGSCRTAVIPISGMEKRTRNRRSKIGQFSASPSFEIRKARHHRR